MDATANTFLGVRIQFSDLFLREEKQLHCLKCKLKRSSDKAIFCEVCGSRLLFYGIECPTELLTRIATSQSFTDPHNAWYALINRECGSANPSIMVVDPVLLSNKETSDCDLAYGFWLHSVSSFRQQHSSSLTSLLLAMDELRLSLSEIGISKPIELFTQLSWV